MEAYSIAVQTAHVHPVSPFLDFELFSHMFFSIIKGEIRSQEKYIVSQVSIAVIHYAMYYIVSLENKNQKFKLLVKKKIKRKAGQYIY